MRVALAGQPNSGKSTIFNALAGYRAITANFPGQTVRYTMSRVRFHGVTFEIVDLPGTYSLTSMDLAELEARRYILSKKADVVVNVIDASLLSRSLEFTLQIMEMDVPMVICLNMMDEARRKGIEIDGNRLSRIVGVPVVETIALKGRGLDELISAVIMIHEKKTKCNLPEFHRDVEEIIKGLKQTIDVSIIEKLKVPPRLLAIRLLEGDAFFMKEVKGFPPILEKTIEFQMLLERSHGRPHDVVISSERHAIAMNIFEKVAKVGRSVRSLQDSIDVLLMHRYLGYLFLLIVLVVFFYTVFVMGRIIENPIISFFASFIEKIGLYMDKEGFPFFILRGLSEGLAGGIGIVIPYLFPFLIGMSILEDIGYLPRMAFLMDAFMHRIGLHGKSILPFVLGYGCSVPAIMATRILETERDRFITALLATMIPCAARTTIIYGLVAAYIGPMSALFIYVLNVLVIAIIGKIATYLMTEVSPGLILEMPIFRMPTFRVVFSKTWLRMKEFIVVAWPILILGSVFLSILEYLRADLQINKLLYPLTYLLGLPEVVGITLIFGILRKELSMIMLFEALGTVDVSSVMSGEQIMVFTLFVLFYVPCVATIAALWREFGWKRTIIISFSTISIAFIVALLARGFMMAI